MLNFTIVLILIEGEEGERGDSLLSSFQFTAQSFKVRAGSYYSPLQKGSMSIADCVSMVYSTLHSI